MKKLLIILGLVLVPVIAWAAASQLTTSFKKQQQTSTTWRYQLFRCDNSGSFAGDGSGPDTGETCESGDWSVPIDCNGMLNLSARYFEYGAGSGLVKIWDCTTSEGVADDITQAPGTSPAANDPGPMCTDLTAGAGVTLDGTTTTLMDLSGLELHYIIGEIDDCTGNCDSTLTISCGR